MLVTAAVTCHNRRDLTLRAMDALHVQQLPPGVTLGTVLVDDGSTDGTAEEVAASFPDVTVLRGDGSLYWTGGMRVAVAEAHRQGADSILWLNDDVSLRTDSIGALVALARGRTAGTTDPPIVVGAVTDPVDGELTYGGLRVGPWWDRLRFRRVPLSDRPVPVDTFEGNCVLVPATVDRRLGGLDDVFVHRIGDVDFGLRASDAGCSVLQASGSVGTCRRDTDYQPWLDPDLALSERFQRLRGPKGLPIGPWLRYARRHGGILWPYAACRPYAAAVAVALRVRPPLRDPYGGGSG